jgi:predicted site-specific integrase-resolvase
MEFVPSRVAAKVLGVHPNTLRLWADQGKIEIIKTASGQRRYNVNSYIGTSSRHRTICYCRVSSYKQKDDLQRQVEFMRTRHPGADIVTDIGSGINFRRKGLRTILESAIDGDKLTVVVAHKDRLCRFGFELIEWIIKRSGGELMVLQHNELSPESELTKDLLTILHVFSCRMHGLRSYKDKISKAFSNKKSEESVQALD